jgi:hypothetical protein
MKEMLRKYPVLILVGILILSALACNFPTRANIAAPTTEGPEATFTALAQTLAVILTETAASTPQAVSETPSPTSPPTTIPATPTFKPMITNTPVPPTPVPCDQAQFLAMLPYRTIRL